MNPAICSSAVNELPRDRYGALKMSEVLSPDLQVQVKALLDEASRAGHLPVPFMTSGKERYECLNLDVYDVLVFRGRVKSLVVQARRFSKNIQKGHTLSEKDYYLVSRSGRQTAADNVENVKCAKRAKNTTSLGQLVKHDAGITTVACKKPYAPVPVLAKTSDGRLVNPFDGRRGGVYYYAGTKYSFRERLAGGHVAYRLRSLGESAYSSESNLAPDEVRPIFLSVILNCTKPVHAPGEAFSTHSRPDGGDACVANGGAGRANGAISPPRSVGPETSLLGGGYRMPFTR